MAQPQAGADERFAHSVGEHFEAFLENYSSEMPEGMDTSAADEPAPRDYIDQVQRLAAIELSGRLALSPPASHRVQCNEMKSNERTTLYVDFSHVQDHNTELADAIEADFHYLEPFLRQALKNLMKREHEEYATDDKDFWVCFFNMQTQLNIRDLKTAKIARLMSFAGTVTRTSEVRPELIEGVFMCETCAAAVHTVVPCRLPCRLRWAAAGGPGTRPLSRRWSVTAVYHTGAAPTPTRCRSSSSTRSRSSARIRCAQAREALGGAERGAGGGREGRGRVARRGAAGTRPCNYSRAAAWPLLLGPLLLASL